jgi:hypothetical protein
MEFETIISLDEGVAWFTGVTELRVRTIDASEIEENSKETVHENSMDRRKL